MAVRLGVVLIALSLLPWLALTVLPFLGLGTAAFAAGGGLIVVAEVAFWLGLVLVGRDTWSLARSHGWRHVPGTLWRVLRHGTADRQPPGTGVSSQPGGEVVPDRGRAEQADGPENGAAEPG
jgi:hypothetical protein